MGNASSTAYESEELYESTSSQSVFWECEPFFRDRSCNFVFTPDELLYFFSTHCQSPWNAGIDLPKCCTRVDKAAFESGYVVIKPPLDISCFNLSALPNELITEIFKHLSPERIHQNVNSMESLTLTSKRMRDLAAPFYLSQFTLSWVSDNRWTKKGRRRLVPSGIDLLYPVPSKVMRYLKSVKVTQDQWFDLTPSVPDLKNARDLILHTEQEVQKSECNLTHFSLSLNGASGVNDQIARDDVELLADYVSKMEGLKTLELCGSEGFHPIAKPFLDSVPPARLDSLILQFDGFSKALTNFSSSMQYLRSLTLPTLPPSDFSMISHSNLQKLVLQSSHSFLSDWKDGWTFQQLHDVLSVCANTLKILHIKQQCTDHNDSDATIRKALIIPFKRLTVLKLIKPSGNGPLEANFFSLAPIRHLSCQASRNDDHLFDMFFNRLAEYRQHQTDRSGWDALEIIATHRSLNPYVGRYQIGGDIVWEKIADLNP